MWRSVMELSALGYYHHLELVTNKRKTGCEIELEDNKNRTYKYYHAYRQLQHIFFYIYHMFRNKMKNISQDCMKTFRNNMQYCGSTLLCGLGKKHKFIDSWIQGFEVFSTHTNLLFDGNQILWISLPTLTMKRISWTIVLSQYVKI